MAFAADLTLIELNTDQAKFVAGNAEILKVQKARAKVMKRQKPLS